MNGRLGILGAFNRPRTLNPLHQSNYDGGSDNGNASNSASYSKLERELKILKVENAKLKSELDDTRVTLKQLISETSHEKFDERRINLLKFQLIQLERQIAILNEALGCRQEAVLEVENSMTWLADKLRSYIAADVKGPVVSVARSDLTSMTEVLESSRIKLFKALEGSGKDTLAKDLIFLNPFLGGKYKQSEPLSLLDISLQRMDYINLRHVAQLESKLCQLYKELIRVYEQLQNTKPKSLLTGHVSCAERDRMETMLLKTCVMLKDIADDLIALSLLCPSSPWPILKRPITKQVPIDRVIAALPALPRSKQEEVTHIIEASLHTCNHHQFLMTKQVSVLKEELAFHRSVYDLQMQYTHALFNAVEKGYGEFETSARSFICKPLKHILDAYKHLKSSASEEALREFLIIVKANEEQIISVVETFSSQNFESDESGSTAFSKFGEEFMGKINLLVRNCQNERDASMKANKTIQETKKKTDLDLQHLIEDLENKYEKTWLPKAEEVPSSSEPKLLLDKTDVSNHKGRKHYNLPREISISESSHPVEVQDLKHTDSNSKLKHHQDGLSVLQNFQNYDDTACKLMSQDGNSKLKNQRLSSDCSPSIQDATKYSTHDIDKDSNLGCKPEWIHDFSGLSDKAEKLFLSADISESGSCMKNALLNKEYTRSSSQTATNLGSNEKPPVKAKKGEYKMNKPLPHVANRTLKLKQSGSLSITDAPTVDFSLSKKDKSDLELDAFSTQNQPSHPGYQTPNNEGKTGELANNEKQKLWR